MRYLVTSALPYINAIKHLGNLVGSMLPADVYARYLRQRGEEVLFICGTDEHGTPAELAAQVAKLPVEEFCRQQHQAQADIYKRFALSFDYFGRTSSTSNHQITQDAFRALKANGFIEDREIAQLYSIDDNRFLPDRYVAGVCPHCGYENARGDQCENCTRLLDPTELKYPRSAVSGSRNLEMRKSRHSFLMLEKLQGEVAAWIERQEQWPVLTQQVARKWLNEGLRPRDITRDLRWGITVPGDEDKVFYVWFDAPFGYVAATVDWCAAKGGAEEWKSWWQASPDVRYVQFMAKDNLPFHTIMWPATLLGTRQNWKFPDYIKGFHWLNYYGGKFSTSLGHGIFLDQALELFPSDYWRYALLTMAPETSDSSFTWNQFQVSINKELADKYGNLVNRITRLSAKHFGETIPDGGEAGPAEAALEAQCRERVDKLNRHYDEIEYRRVCQTLCELWDVANTYINSQAPWATVSTDRVRAAVTLRTGFNLIRMLAIVSAPVIPHTSDLIRCALKLNATEFYVPVSEACNLSALAGNHPFTLLEPLFKKIPDEAIEVLIAKYSDEAAQ
jgi:methionyl-tRNA synthetase